MQQVGARRCLAVLVLGTLPLALLLASVTVQAQSDPTAAQNLRAEVLAGGGGADGAALSWDAPAADAATVTGYRILRSAGASAMTVLTRDGLPGGAHFSPLVGAVHSARVTFLESEEMASAGIESMAEVGGTSALASEVNTAISASPPTALSVLSRSRNIGTTGTATLSNVALTTDHPRVTLTTMVAPSHDWFVGVSGLSLLDASGHWLRSHEVELFPWDAGTENGTDFSLGSPGTPTDPQGVITSIPGTDPFSTEPVATLTFTLQSLSTTRSVAENTAAGENIGAPVVAADSSGTFTYALGGTDASSFDIDATTGQLQTKAALDYETRSSYEVTVTATDANGSTDITVAVDVINVVELLPAMSGPASVSYAENRAVRAATYTASSLQDHDLITWTLSGDDAAQFSVDSPPGVLRFHIDPVAPNVFLQLPDFEDPADADADNVYSVTLAASDGTETVTLDVSVTVGDANEAGTLTLSTTRPRLGEALTATPIDQDGITGPVAYRWERSAGRNAWVTIADAHTGRYTPAAAETGHFLRVTATYADEHGTGKTVSEGGAQRGHGAPVDGSDGGDR